MLEDFRLKVFMTVASRGSFTLAAKELGISQPAVSQNVAELEKSVGTELLVRSRGSVALTPAGRSLIEYAEKIQYWYSAASGLFSAGDGVTPGSRIRIAACTASAEVLLPKALARMQSVMPGHSFSIVGCDAPSAECRLRLSVHGQQIPLGESRTIIRTINPTALASSTDPGLLNATSAVQVRPEYSFACWSGYSEQLPPDLRSRVCLESDSVPALLQMAAYSQKVIALAPLIAVPDGLKAIPLVLPGLAADVHFLPSDSFVQTRLCSILKGVLQDI